MLMFRVLVHHASSILALVRDPTEPTTFFKSYRIGDKGVVLRAWRKPYFFKPFNDATQEFMRSRKMPELQRGPRPSA